MTARRCFATELELLSLARRALKSFAAFSTTRRIYATKHRKTILPTHSYFECKTFLHGLFLIGDKLSMASGLEERFPFMDNALVDFAQRLPIRHKLADLEQMLLIDEDEVSKKALAQSHYDVGKSALRRAMAPLLPDAVMKRPKQGFSAPDGSWYRGENADYVRDLLLGADLAWRISSTPISYGSASWSTLTGEPIIAF